MCLIRMSPSSYDDAYVYNRGSYASRHSYHHSPPRHAAVVVDGFGEGHYRHSASMHRRSRLLHPQEDADIAANAAAHAAASAVREEAFYDSRSPSRNRHENEAFAEGYRAGRAHHVY